MKEKEEKGGKRGEKGMQEDRKKGKKRKRKKNPFQPLFQSSLHLYSLCLLACENSQSKTYKVQGSFRSDTKECVCFLLYAELSMSKFGEELQILKSQLLCGFPGFCDYANSISKGSILFLLKLYNFLSTCKKSFSFSLYLFLTSYFKKHFYVL